MSYRRFLSSAAGIVRRPDWIPSPQLKYTLREIDPQSVRPSGWAPPMGGYENIPFRVCSSSSLQITGAVSHFVKSENGRSPTWTGFFLLNRREDVDETDNRNCVSYFGAEFLSIPLQKLTTRRVAGVSDGSRETAASLHGLSQWSHAMHDYSASISWGRG
jgi:hypothetical protein